MTEILTKIVVDCSTGEESILPLTEEELAQREADKAEFIERENARIAAEEALSALKASAKEKLITGQPLTEEEASVLII